MFLKNGCKKLAAVLMVLSLIFGFSSFLTLETADASGYSVTITLDGEQCAVFTQDDLDAMVDVGARLYSAINTWPTKKWYAAEGVKLATLLEAAEIDTINEVKLITIKSRDGYRMTFTKKQLLDDERYYYPGLKDVHEYFGQIPGSPEGAVPVDAILALRSVDSDNLNGMSDKNAPLLVFGQRWVTEQTNHAFAKYVSEIQLSTAEPEKWDAPTATPAAGIVQSGTQVRLSNLNMDADKVYYTTDGTDPTYKSPIYNWIAKRWWSSRMDELDEINHPIEITGGTTIKAITIGLGKEDSDIVTFEYQVPSLEPAPEITADTTDNTVGNSIELTFADDEAWRNAITEVTVNGSTVASDKYAVAAGMLTIDASVFTAAGDYDIVIKATGYEDTVVMQTIVAAPTVFTVEGNAIPEVSYTMAELKAMPATTKTFGTRVCKGVDLKYLLESLNIDDTSWTLKIKTKDFSGGIAMDLSYALDPANNCLLTYESDGSPVTDGPLRLYHGDGSSSKQNYKYVIGIIVTKPVILDPPTLVADSTDNTVGNPIELTFEDNEAWRNAFTEVTVNGSMVASDKYAVAAGMLTIDASVFTAAGDYDIVIKATGYQDATVTQSLTAVGSRTWYVDCSGGADFTTIQAAVTAAGAGDTIIVKDGNYTENVVVDKSLVICSENGADQTIVQAADADLDVYKVEEASEVTIDGFTISGATLTGRAGIKVFSASSCTVINNQCSGNNEGIYITGGNGNTISNNTVTNSAKYGIELGGTTGNSVINNIVSENTAGSGYGIYLADNANSNTVSDNVADSNTIGIRVKNAYNNVIFNNTSFNNSYGLELATNSAGNVFYLNNFMDNTSAQLNPGFWAAAGNFWNSQEELPYEFDGTQYNGFLGNYWSDYTGEDADGNGIGDTPYQTISTDSDNYPLMGQWQDGAIIVPAVTPKAAFTAAPTSGTAPLTVSFTDESTGTAPLNYAWDFDNNGTIDSTEQNPTHVYSTAGTYSVKLTVTNAAGTNEEVKTDYIVVNPAPVGPQIMLNCNSGIPGVTTFVTGSDFDADTAGTIWFDTNDNGVLDDGEPSVAVNTDADGAIPLLTSLTVPSASTGSYTVRADFGGIEANAGFTITDSGIIVSPTIGNPRVSSSLTVTGSGFTPNTSFRLFCDRDGDGLFDGGMYRSGTTTASGTLSVTGMSWPSAPTGIYNVILDLNYNDTIDASASICVIPSIKISMPRGFPETNIGMNIDGFQANATGYVWFDTNGNGVWDEDENRAPVTTSGAGTAITPGLYVPSIAPGDYQVCAEIPACGLKASAPYSITGMTLNPSSGTAGTEIEIAGYGYVTNQTTGKYIWFDTNGNGTWDADEPKVDVTTDANGNLSPVSLTAPAVPAGSYNVCANVWPSGTFAVFTLEDAAHNILSVQAEPADILLGDSFTVSVNIENIQDVQGYQVTLKYDTDYAGYKSHQVNFKPDGQVLNLIKEGEVMIGNFVLGDADWAQDSGALVEIEFESRYPGTIEGGIHDFTFEDIEVKLTPRDSSDPTIITNLDSPVVKYYEGSDVDVYAKLELREEDHGGITSVLKNGSRYEETTGSDGRVTFEMVRPGENYSLSLNAGGYLRSVVEGIVVSFDRENQVGTPDAPVKLYAGDINDDGEISLMDISLVASKYGHTGTPGWVVEDINLDGIVDIEDLSAIARNYNLTVADTTYHYKESAPYWE